MNAHGHSEAPPRLEYGAHPDQFVDLWEGDPPSQGIAVLVHGGYWRATFTADLMLPLVHDLRQRGWAVANVEYRRVGADGGWPLTLRDVEAAVAAVREDAARRREDGPVISVGHSVGGQLALLTASAVDAVVALAPVTDIARTHAEHLGEGAAAPFMGATPEEAPEAYEAASPLHRLPVGRPVLVVHGPDDVRVPIDHTRSYVAAARAAGDDVELREPAGTGHRELIAPDQDLWPSVASWMSAVPPRRARPGTR